MINDDVKIRAICCDQTIANTNLGNLIMFVVSKSKAKSNPVPSRKSSGSRVSSGPLPPQWRNRPRRNQKNFPILIRVLLLFQYTSSVLTLGGIAITLVMYGLTVYTQQLWNRQYEKLQTLQRHERTVISINEALKDEIIESGNRTRQNLVPLTPDRMIYLQPAPIPESPDNDASSPEKLEPPQINDRPLGY